MLWKMWLLFDPRRIMIALAAFLAVLALLIHFLCLGSERLNWINMPVQASVAPPQVTSIV